MNPKLFTLALYILNNLITFNQQEATMKINETNNNASHQINKGSLSGIGRKNSGFSLSLYVNGQSEQVTVKVIDNKSKETMYETSSQDLHDIHDQIYDMAGRLLKKRV